LSEEKAPQDGWSEAIPIIVFEASKSGVAVTEFPGCQYDSVRFNEMGIASLDPSYVLRYGHPEKLEQSGGEPPARYRSLARIPSS
jgi:hypothetical protein